MPIPAIAMAVPAIAQAGSSLYNYYNNKSALNTASKKTPQEKEYLERLNKRRTKGALDVPKLTNQVANQAYQAGEFAKQNVQGNIVKSGLDNSIVAQELRRKTDVDTMKSIAESSREIAMKNETTKKSAEGEYDQHLLTESQRLRNIAMKRAENKGQLASGLISAVGSGASAVAGGLDFDSLRDGDGKFKWDELSKQLFKSGKVKGNNLGELDLDSLKTILGELFKS
mgnify:CR=1 FL=1